MDNQQSARALSDQTNINCMNEEVKNIYYYRWSAVFIFYISTKITFARAKYMASLNTHIYMQHTFKIKYFLKAETYILTTYSYLNDIILNDSMRLGRKTIKGEVLYLQDTM